MKEIFFTLTYVLIHVTASAQINLQNYDTIPIRKPTEHKLIYGFDNSFFSVLSIRRKDAIAEGNYRSAASSTSPNNLMGIVGAGPVPNYLFPSVIESDPQGYEWQLDYYTRGTTRNNKLKTEDGKNIEVPTNLMGYWQSGSLGVLRRGIDSIGVFGLSEQPEKDSLFRSVYLATRGLHPPVDPKRKKMDYDFKLIYKNWGVFGAFKGAELMVIFYEKNRTAYIFLNGHLDAIFQIDYDIPDARMIRITRNYPRVPPVFLIRTGLTELQEADLSRLAIFCMLMAQITRGV